jgi:type II secretory pathway component GspD/PulD (secretin)
MEAVDRDGWIDFGGSTSSMHELNDNLIITTTSSNHRSITGLLSMLREADQLQINVEARVLDVTTDWFEQIGVDLDLYFNTNSTMFRQARAADPNFQLGDFFGPDGRPLDPLMFGGIGQRDLIGFPPGSDENPLGINAIATGQAFGVTDPENPQNITYVTGPVGTPIRNRRGFSPIGVTQDTLGLTGALADFAQGTFAGTAVANPALVFGMQFLDDIQVDLLIEATQADRRSVVLQAPRLTFPNGKGAFIAVARGETFVSNMQAVVGEGGVAFRPQIDRVFQGFVLRIMEGVVSADRRYVRLMVVYDSAEIIRFEEATARAQARGGQFGGTGQAFENDFQLPIIDGQNIRTSVTVPDKGTIMLGGARNVREIEVETGVPVLSKIPFINRFFTNRITSKEERSLLILIRPEVIIQQENEDLLFPGLTDQLGGSASGYLR